MELQLELLIEMNQRHIIQKLPLSPILFKNRESLTQEKNVFDIYFICSISYIQVK